MRVKRGIIKKKRKKNILERTKGFRGGRKSKKRQAKEAIAHAGSHAFADRRKKKRDFRRLWQIRIGATLKPYGISYSKFIKKLKDNNIELDRKILSELARDESMVFENIVRKIK